MKRTRIEWCDYTINPVKGLCPMHCKTPSGYEYCYAAGERGLYKRFKWNPDIEWCPRVFRELDKLGAGSRVFIGSTMELFGPWVKEIWMKLILEEVLLHPALTFIFLTKQPQNLPKWSPFPENCWVGVSATNAKMAEEAGFWLWEVKAKVKFVSFEPLLEEIPAHFADYISEDTQGISWVIIGQCTLVRKATRPKKIWIDEIIDATKKVSIPYFLKDNLKSIMGNNLIQEFPKVKEQNG